MQPALSEGVVTAAYGAVEAASTVVAFFLGFDISRMTSIRDALQTKILDIRIEARKAYFSTGRPTPRDFFTIEDAMVRDAHANVFHPTALLLAIITFGLSNYFLYHVMNVVAVQGSEVVHPLVRQAGAVLRLLQALGILYHIATAIQMRIEIGRTWTINSLLLGEPTSSTAIQARDSLSKERLDIEMPDWPKLLSPASAASPQN